jgi:hypothetical protein
MIGTGQQQGWDQGFWGPAIAIRGDNGMPGGPNCNNWSVYNTNEKNCRNALYIMGSDANAGLAYSVHSHHGRTADFRPLQWSFADFSHIGNAFVACHTDGGSGWIAVNTSSILFGCYAEQGTINRIGQSSTSISSTVSDHLGDPAAWAAGRWRRLSLGGPVPTPGDPNAPQTGDPIIEFFPNTREGYPVFANYYWRGQNQVGPAIPITHRRAGQIAGDSVNGGWHVWAGNTKQARQYAYAIADTDNQQFQPLSIWFPSGVMIGDSDAKFLDPTAQSVFRFESRSLSRDLGGNEQLLNDTPVRGIDQPRIGSTDGWHLGDVVVDTNRTDTYPFRICVRPDPPGPIFTPAGGIGGYMVLALQPFDFEFDPGGLAYVPIGADIHQAAYFTQCIEVRHDFRGAGPGGSVIIHHKDQPMPNPVEAALDQPSAFIAESSSEIVIGSGGRLAQFRVMYKEFLLQGQPLGSAPGDLDPRQFGQGGSLPGGPVPAVFADTLRFEQAMCPRWVYNRTGQILHVTTGWGTDVVNGQAGHLTRVSAKTIDIPDGMAAWIVCNADGDMLRMTDFCSPT